MYPTRETAAVGTFAIWTALIYAGLAVYGGVWV